MVQYGWFVDLKCFSSFQFGCATFFILVVLKPLDASFPLPSLHIQGGHLPVVSRVITPFIGVISPQLPIYFRPSIGATHVTFMYNDPLR